MSKTKTTTSVKKPAADSKKAQAMKIIKRMQSRKTPASRAEIIETLQAKCELSANGAATYYQNVKTGKAGWV